MSWITFPRVQLPVDSILSGNSCPLLNLATGYNCRCSTFPGIQIIFLLNHTPKSIAGHILLVLYRDQAKEPPVYMAHIPRGLILVYIAQDSVSYCGMTSDWLNVKEDPNLQPIPPLITLKSISLISSSVDTSPGSTLVLYFCLECGINTQLNFGLRPLFAIWEKFWFLFHFYVIFAQFQIKICMKFATQSVNARPKSKRRQKLRIRAIAYHTEQNWPNSLENSLACVR